MFAGRCERVCVCPSHLAGRGVRGRLPQPCFMADINPGASGHQARLDCKRGGGKALSPSPLLRVSAAGTVPGEQGCVRERRHCLFFQRQLYVRGRQPASYRRYRSVMRSLSLSLQHVMGHLCERGGERS